jgi:hypothetical protein
MLGKQWAPTYLTPQSVCSNDINTNSLDSYRIFPMQEGNPHDTHLSVCKHISTTSQVSFSSQYLPFLLPPHGPHHNLEFAHSTSDTKHGKEQIKESPTRHRQRRRHLSRRPHHQRVSTKRTSRKETKATQTLRPRYRGRIRLILRQRKQPRELATLLPRSRRHRKYTQRDAMQSCMYNIQELLSPPFPSCHTWCMNMELTPDQQAMRGIWVNIYDFIDAKAAGMQVKRFKSERALSHYTRRTGRIYPKERAKKGGPVRALLAHIFG